MSPEVKLASAKPRFILKNKRLPTSSFPLSPLSFSLLRFHSAFQFFALSLGLSDLRKRLSDRLVFFLKLFWLLHQLKGSVLIELFFFFFFLVLIEHVNISFLVALGNLTESVLQLYFFRGELLHSGLREVVEGLLELFASLGALLRGGIHAVN